MNSSFMARETEIKLNKKDPIILVSFLDPLWRHPLSKSEVQKLGSKNTVICATYQNGLLTSRASKSKKVFVRPSIFPKSKARGTLVDEMQNEIPLPLV